MQARIERVRAKQKDAKVEAKECGMTLRTLRRMRGKQRPGSEWLGPQAHEQSGLATQAVPEVDKMLATRSGPVMPELRVVAAKAMCLDLACFRFGCRGNHSLDGSGQ